MCISPRIFACLRANRTFIWWRCDIIRVRRAPAFVMQLNEAMWSEWMIIERNNALMNVILWVIRVHTWVTERVWLISRPKSWISLSYTNSAQEVITELFETTSHLNLLHRKRFLCSNQAKPDDQNSATITRTQTCNDYFYKP